MEKKYIRKNVESVTGMPARRIQFYTDEGLIKLDEQHTGRGKERRYSKADMFRILLIQELVKIGISLSAIKNIFCFIDSKVNPENLNPDRYEADKNTTSWLVIYEETIEFFDTHGTSYRTANGAVRKAADKSVSSVEIDMGENVSASIINIRRLAEKLNSNLKE